MPKISVVVPIFNVENYLERCVCSILQQSLQDIEVILVDDGSADASPQIADSLSRADTRVHVVHQANMGLGPARNTGIERATGEYIGFVDSDDWLDPDTYLHLYEEAVAVDADACYGGMKVMKNGTVQGEYKNAFAGQMLSGDRAIFKYRAAYYGDLPNKSCGAEQSMSSCIAIYKTAFLNENGIRFEKVLSEDKFFNISVCRRANAICCTAGTGYCYRKDGQASITHTFKHDTIDLYMDLFDRLERLASTEADWCVDECLLRVNRCVVDYTRALIGMIADSSIRLSKKVRLVGDVLCRPQVNSAYDTINWRALPVKQQIFCLVVRANLRLPLIALSLLNRM